MITAVLFLFVKMLKPYKCPSNGRMKKYILLHLHNAISQSCQYEWTGDNSVNVYIFKSTKLNKRASCTVYIHNIHTYVIKI